MSDAPSFTFKSFANAATESADGIKTSIRRALMSFGAELDFFLKSGVLADCCKSTFEGTRSNRPLPSK